jgi:hypothetical protein
MRVFLVVILAALLALPAAVGTAAAQTTPGGSEFDQYVPEVPEAEEDVPLKDKQGKKDGNRDASDGGGSAGGGAAIAPQTSGVQDQTTTDDDAAASRRDGDGNGTRDSASSARDQFQVGGTSSAGAVADTLSGESDGGIGIGLPLLLAATVAAGIGYVLVRRRVISRKRSAGPGGG